MYTALCWIPRGTAKAVIPTAPPGSEEKSKNNAFKRRSAAAAGKRDAAMKDVLEEEDHSESSGSEDSDEVHIAEVLADDLDNLAAFKSNLDDPYLKHLPEANAMYDVDEKEDLEVKCSDALILACKMDDDVSTLEVHLLENDIDESGDESDDGPYVPNVYVHHDLILPASPLCAAYTSMEAEAVEGESSELWCNFVAVGMYEYSGIDIWDVERMDNLLPALTLGGPDLVENGISGGSSMGAVVPGKKKKKRRKKRTKLLPLKEGSHTGPVMCLAWHPTQKHYLASGSQDCTVKVWDTRTGDCVATLEHHGDKVQSLAWHPEDEAILLTGSFDATIKVVNVQTSKVLGAQNVDSDIESVHWLSKDTILAATEKGTLSAFSYTPAKLSQIAYVEAHAAEVSACQCSPSIPGMVVTGSTDNLVKVWDFSNPRSPKLIHEMKSGAGAVFSIVMEPWEMGSGGTPFLCAWAGARGNLVIRDLAVVSGEVRERWNEFLKGRLGEVIGCRAARFEKSKKGIFKPTAADESDQADDSDSDRSEEDQ